MALKEGEVELVALARPAQVIFHHSIIARGHKVRHILREHQNQENNKRLRREDDGVGGWFE